jgi:hypothetical protein
LTPGSYAVRASSTTYLDDETFTETSSTALNITIDTTAPTVTSVAFSRCRFRQHLQNQRCSQCDSYIHRKCKRHRCTANRPCGTNQQIRHVHIRDWNISTAVLLPRSIGR